MLFSIRVNVHILSVKVYTFNLEIPVFFADEQSPADAIISTNSSTEQHLLIPDIDLAFAL